MVGPRTYPLTLFGIFDYYIDILTNSQFKRVVWSQHETSGSNSTPDYDFER